jgi:RNA polymerase sigma-70 factor, ECF subfamily
MSHLEGRRSRGMDDVAGEGVQGTRVGPATRESFPALYEELAPTVERWVLRLGGPWIDAQDVVHDVFVLAFRHWDSFRGDAAVSTWLFRITERLVRKRRQREIWKRVMRPRHAEDLRPAPGSPDGLAYLESRARVELLYRALGALPEKYRTPLVMFEIEELPGEEVARLLDLDIATLWTRLHRGRALLAKAVRKQTAAAGHRA